MRFLATALLLSLATPLAAGRIDEARALLAEGRTEEALAALDPAARSGNADAEEMIGVIYSLGLGGMTDEVRAFEWHQRAALKGHAGAQMSLGWCYELGMGLPAADPARAFLWYRLAEIGGHPDAAEAVEALRAKLAPEEIEKAHAMIADYKGWLYPYR
ncbi:tetratricopeptide repeat protein [Salipiger abyssi]|uniref:tetratricopeptide repeat protein n=1 Tax=Salipiger abyssi TaxID=1250539 RepID=UPI001A8D7602|nr:SEL1-like repeat protein [Salipiger abyssi]MBN9888586.1 sel1 repeat family protein [Salipiger abyssi]